MHIKMFWVLYAALLGSLASVSLAQASDPKQQADAATALFKEAIAAKQSKIETKLREGIGRAEASKKQNLQAELEDFLADPDQLPSSLPDESRAFQSELKTEHRAYRTRIDGFVKRLNAAAREEDAAAVQEAAREIEESTFLIEETDLLPTVKLPSESKWTRDGRTLIYDGSARTVLPIVLGNGKEYAIEMTLSRADSQGPVRIAFRGAHQGMLVLGESGSNVQLRDVASPDSGGVVVDMDGLTLEGSELTDIRLEVRASGVAVAVNDGEPVKWSPATGAKLQLSSSMFSEMKGAQLAVICVAPGVRIESMTHRTLEPEEGAEAAKKPVVRTPQFKRGTPKKPAGDANQAPFADGTEWTGTWVATRPGPADGKATVTVVSREDDEVTLKIALAGNRTWQAVCYVNGSELRSEPQDVKGKGRRKRVAQDVIVTGSVNGDSLRLQYDGSINKRKSKNNDFTGTVNVSR